MGSLYGQLDPEPVPLVTVIRVEFYSNRRQFDIGQSKRKLVAQSYRDFNMSASCILIFIKIIRSIDSYVYAFLFLIMIISPLEVAKKERELKE